MFQCACLFRAARPAIRLVNVIVSQSRNQVADKAGRSECCSPPPPGRVTFRASSFRLGHLGEPAATSVRPAADAETESLTLRLFFRRPRQFCFVWQKPNETKLPFKRAGDAFERSEMAAATPTVRDCAPARGRVPTPGGRCYASHDILKVPLSLPAGLHVNSRPTRFPAVARGPARPVRRWGPCRAIRWCRP